MHITERKRLNRQDSKSFTRKVFHGISVLVVVCIFYRTLKEAS